MDRQEREKKEEYLNQYRDNVRYIHRLTEEIAELRELKMSASAVSNDGMPRGGDQRDLSDYMVRIDSMIQERENEFRKRVMLFDDILKKIKSLKNQNEDDVMFYKYIRRKNFAEIAEKMNYSERHTRRIHNKALEHLRIPEEDGDESN